MRRVKFAAAAASAGLVAVVLFLIDQGRVNADQWSSSLSFVLAYAGLAGTVVGWLATRAESVAGAGEVVQQLRAMVRRQWADEVQARDLQSPRPLRLRWRPTHRPVMTAARSARSRWALSGELLQDDGDSRPAAVALHEAFTARNLRQLVVLGRPGGGKSTLAMLYVLAASESPEAGDPVPVLLSVAGWDPAGSIEDWIEGRIIEDYPVFGTNRCLPTLRSLVRDGGVTAVLDGLDEMPSDLLPKALHELEKASARGLRSLVTCRAGEFEATVDQAGVLAHAEVVEIEPITVEDAALFLTQREVTHSQRWASVLAEMHDHPDGAIATTLRTPLTVSLARQVFRAPDSQPSELTGLGSAQEVQQRLLDRFVPSVYPGRRGAARAARYLSFLSHHLRDVVRDPDLHWWELSRTVPTAVITVGIALTATVTALVAVVVLAVVICLSDDDFTSFGGLLAEMIGGALAIGIVLGAFSGLHAGRIARAPRRPGLLRAVVADLATILALLCMAAGALAIVLLFDYCTSRPSAYALNFLIQDLFDYWVGVPDARLELSVGVLVLIGGVALTNVLSFGLGGSPRRASLQGRTIVPSLMFGMGVGSVFGLIATVVYVVAVHRLSAWPGAVTAAGFGIPLALGRWLNAPGETRRAPSPESVLVADRSALVVSAVVVAGSVQFVALPLLAFWGSIDFTVAWFVTLCCAVGVFGVVFLGSGSSWVSYTVARTWLSLRGCLPWRLSRFLREARNLGVLRQAGPAYQIRHDLIRNHLADQWRGPSRSRRQDVSPGWIRRHPRLAVAAGSAVIAVLLPTAVIFVDSREQTDPIAVYDTTGLGAAVMSVAVGSDGSVSAASFEDRQTDDPWSVMHWAPGDLRGTVHRGTSALDILDLAVDPAGDLAVTQSWGYAFYDRHGRRWGPASGQGVTAAGFVGDDLVTVTQTGVVQEWPSTKTARPVTLIHQDQVDSIASSAHPRIVVTESAGKLRVWNPRTGAVQVITPPASSYRDSIRISTDGSTLAMSGYDGVVVWRLGAGGFREVHRLPGFSWEFAVSPDGTLIAKSTDRDGLELFDTVAGRRVATLSRTGCKVTAVAFDETGSHLAEACSSSIKLWPVLALIAGQA